MLSSHRVVERHRAMSTSKGLWILIFVAEFFLNFFKLFFSVTANVNTVEFCFREPPQRVTDNSVTLWPSENSALDVDSSSSRSSSSSYCCCYYWTVRLAMFFPSFIRLCTHFRTFQVAKKEENYKNTGWRVWCCWFS